MEHSEGAVAWWQMTRTAKQGFWLAAGFLTIGLPGWVVIIAGASDVLSTVISIGFTILGLCLLASATALRRRGNLTRKEEPES